jgi:hypothetical protein
MGAYAMVDWSAIFNEVHLPANTDNSYNTPASVTIGLAPAVTALLTTYDGGKLMVGYSTFDNFTTFGWVMKLWGYHGTTFASTPTVIVNSTSTTNCNQYDKPAGHVVFSTNPFNVKGTSSACNTTT